MSNLFASAVSLHFRIYPISNTKGWHTIHYDYACDKFFRVKVNDLYYNRIFKRLYECVLFLFGV